MKRLLFAPFALGLFMFFSFPVYAAESLILTIDPQGPLNPGDKYDIKINALATNGEPCIDCTITTAFNGDPQPLDSIEPITTKTSNEGITYVSATSYAPKSRELIIKLTQPDSEPIEKTIELQYNENYFLSVINSIKKALSFGIPFPPMGNTYAKITKQAYKEGDTRTLYLKYSSPFGTKRFDIYYSLSGDEKNVKLFKSTTDTETTIEVSAFKDVYIMIEACTGDGPSCVTSNPLTAPKISDSEAAVKEDSIPVENEGIQGNTSKELDEFLEKEEKEINSNPFSNLFKAVYK